MRLGLLIWSWKTTTTKTNKQTKLNKTERFLLRALPTICAYGYWHGVEKKQTERFLFKKLPTRCAYGCWHGVEKKTNLKGFCLKSCQRFVLRAVDVVLKTKQTEGVPAKQPARAKFSSKQRTASLENTIKEKTKWRVSRMIRLTACSSQHRRVLI